MIADKLQDVRRRIAESCTRAGRDANDVTLVCVTKEASVSLMEEALALGVNTFGENRVQDALVKYKTIGDKAIWHLVGHLQTNKVKDAVRVFSLIHSVDSERLAKEIDKEATKIGKVQDVLVQVNTSGEDTKFGIAYGGTEEFLKNISLYPNISMKGLMTIAPEVDDPEKVRLYFRKLRELRDSINAIPACQQSEFRQSGRRNAQYAVRIVCVLTGHGLKDPDRAIATIEKPKVVKPDVKAVLKEIGL